ncbi:MAG: hypothetical protein ACAH83_08090 [Alphaproteobacteria bacterium]
MVTNEHMLKSAFFIGIKNQDDSFTPKGTGFFVTHSYDSTNFIYLVTAAHVVCNIHNISKKPIYIRVNRKDADAELIEVDYSHWRFHQGLKTCATDVAVAAADTLLPKVEILAIGTTLFLTDKKIKEHKVGVGDDVLLVGLFRNHYGHKDNMPIVRTGNIAAFPIEPLKTQKLGKIEGYLVETRSIGGLSGCPVLHLKNNKTTESAYHLLGLMHGHFEIENAVEDVVIEDAAEGKTAINTGIGIVIPAKRILEVIEDFITERRTKVV